MQVSLQHRNKFCKYAIYVHKQVVLVSWHQKYQSILQIGVVGVEYSSMVMVPIPYAFLGIGENWYKAFQEYSSLVLVPILDTSVGIGKKKKTQ